MGFINRRNYDHSTGSKTAVLLVNLGTPEAPTAAKLRPYLRQFLSDPRVVEIPRLLWLLILHGIILRVRPKKSAHAYASIWQDGGSPLAIHTKALTQGVDAKLGEHYLIDYAMRYGQPSVSNQIQSLIDRGTERLLVLPLYPQYSCSTTASVVDAVADDFTKRRWLPELRVINQYHDDPRYITALADSVRQYQATHGSGELLLFSFHGTPQRYLLDGDPYHCQCQKTARLVAEELGLTSDQYQVTFQSRFGKAQWLQPYTDKTLMALPTQGTKHVQVICPGFSADCLETLEEIKVENKEYFIEAGGERFDYIDCLNSSDAHIQLMSDLIKQHTQGWPESVDRNNTASLANATSDNRP